MATMSSRVQATKGTPRPANTSTGSTPAKIDAGRAPAPAAHLEVVHRLHALLHTMRSIEQHEEHLCTLLHHVQTSGRLEPAVAQELDILLGELPALSYQADLDALRHALPVPVPSGAAPRISKRTARK